MKHQLHLPLTMLLLALFLSGLDARGGGALSCSCREERLPGGEGSGGGVSKSEHYSLNRSQLGLSFNDPASPSEQYRASANLGSFLHQAEVRSDTYQIQHPLTFRVLQMPEELQLQYNEFLETRAQQLSETR